MARFFQRVSGQGVLEFHPAHFTPILFKAIQINMALSILQKLKLRYGNAGRNPTIEVIRRRSNQIRLHEWRSSPELVTKARDVLENPAMLEMIDVLNTEHPAKIGLFRVTLEDRAIAQARIEGYQLCINNLEAMGTFVKPKVEPEATYEQPEDEMTQQRT